MRLLFVGGSSIGHIAPLIAVAEVLQAEPDRQIHVLCTDQQDERAILEKAHLPFSALPFSRARLRQAWSIVSAFFRARTFLRTWKPDVVFSKGGTVSLPVCFAAHLERIPIVLHESDIVMGRANRIVSRWASVICLGSPIVNFPLSIFHWSKPIIVAEIFIRL